LIPHSKPWITDEDIAAVTLSLQSLMIGQGDLAARFEFALSAWIAAGGGVAIGSGAGAVALALKVLGVTELDKVLLPTYVCTSVAEAIVTTGAEPVLCDVGADWVMTPETVASRLTPDTKAIIVPHIYGIQADISGLKQFGIPIIEDCAQALGYSNQHHIQGDIAVFSFHPTKCLTTGEGGMVVSNSPELVHKMRALRDGALESISPRFFSPMSDMASALGLSQLSRYHEGLDRRAEIANRYKALLREKAPHCLNENALRNSMYFRFPIKLVGGVDKYSELFYKRGIVVRKGVDRLIHRVMGLHDRDFSRSCELFSSTVSLPIYPALNNEELNKIIKVLEDVI